MKTSRIVEESIEKRGSTPDRSANTTAQEKELKKLQRRIKRNLKGLKAGQTSVKKRRRRVAEGSLAAIKPWTWKPGQSGNPGGRPKNDMAAEIARAIFQNNPKMIYQSFSKALAKGNAYSFDVLANRGFGKLTDKIEVTTEKELLDALMAGRKRALQKKAKNADTD